MEHKSRTNLERIRAKNPCYDESTHSLNCLNRTSDKEQCQKEIDNYNKCTKFWYDIEQFRRRHRIRPHLPEAEERNRIKEQFLKTRNFSLVCNYILENRNNSN